MTNYINPSTYSGGAQQIVVAERAVSSSLDEAPYDDQQYVRVNGEWVPVDTPEFTPDTLAPKPPTSLASSGTVTEAGTAVDYTLMWVAPTQNVDDSPLTDLNYFVVRWRYTSGPWASFVSNEASCFLPGITPGPDIQWEVLARDTSGNDSTWAGATIDGMVDTVGPVKPSLPVLTTQLATITARWDGLDYAGATPVPDFSHLEFYSSATPGGPWAYVSRIEGAGSAIISGVPVGATRYVTTVAVDTSGNDSVRSGEASIVVVGVMPPDVDETVWENIDSDIAAAKAEGALNAQEKADLAEANAIAAANAQAQILADEAEAAAVAAASLDAQAKADQAEADAKAASAVTAQEMADAAEAQAHASATAAAAADAAAKAAAAEAAAIEYASTMVIGPTQIADDAITTPKIKAGAVVAGSIAANAVIAEKIKAGEVIAGKLAADAVLADNIKAGAVTTLKLDAEAVTADKIAANAVVAGKIDADAVTANTIAAGALQVEKISSGSIAAGVDIVAGDINGNHASMSDVGFKAFTADPEDGLPNEVVRMGSDTGDVFAVTDSAGAVKASISETGSGAFTGLSVDATEWDAESKPSKGLVIYGVEFFDYLDPVPKGMVAYGMRNSSMNNITTTETKYLELQTVLQPGRMYRIESPSLYCSGILNQRMLTFLRIAYDGTAVGITSEQIGSARVIAAGVASAYRNGGMVNHINTDAWVAPREVRILLSGAAEGSGTFNIVSNSTYPVEIIVEDKGRGVADTGIDYSIAVPPVTKQKYVSVWNASNSADYLGSGSADSYSDDLKQGYSSASGDSHAVIVFASNAVSGETSKTVATALTGATLNKAEVYLYANHWYYNSGGTALIRAYNSTALSGSTPTGTVKSVASWPKPGGKWVDITSIATVSIRGVTLGKAGSTNLLYYGRFNSHTQANKPQLRLTYTR